MRNCGDRDEELLRVSGISREWPVRQRAPLSQHQNCATAGPIGENSSVRYDVFSHEGNLNLLDKLQILDMCVAHAHCEVAIDTIRLFGWPINLMLTIPKAIHPI